MSARSRLCLGLAAAVVASLLAGSVSPATALQQGRGYDGECTGADATTGTTFVIDFQDLDGNDGRAAPTLVRCSPAPVPYRSRTGLEAIKDAGIEIAGVKRWGEAFVCRIENRPAADEPVDIGGNPYREQCIDTPPGAAYWSYWHADGRGEDWEYSTWGISGRTVLKGGFEGWSFSHNASSTTNAPPRSSPRNDALDPDAPAARLSFDLLENRITLGESARLVWGSERATSMTAVSVEPSSGGGSWSGRLLGLDGSRTIAPTRAGTYTYTVRASGKGGRTDVAAATLTVVPSPTATFAVGAVKGPQLRGNPLTVRASGLDPRETYSVRLGGRAVGTGTASADGTVEKSVTIPSTLPEARQRLEVVGSAPGRSGGADVRIVGAKKLPVRLSASRVKRSRSVVVTASGLAPGEAVSIVFGGKTFRGTATGRGVFAKRLAVGSRTGRKTIVVRGAYRSRTGSVVVTVVR